MAFTRRARSLALRRAAASVAVGQHSGRRRPQLSGRGDCGPGARSCRTAVDGACLGCHEDARHRDPRRYCNDRSRRRDVCPLCGAGKGRAFDSACGRVSTAAVRSADLVVVYKPVPWPGEILNLDWSGGGLTHCAREIGVASNNSIVYFLFSLFPTRESAFRSKANPSGVNRSSIGQFCHSSVAVSLTGNLPEDRHLASENTIHDARRQRSGSGACR